ncbi:hypothetical protein [Serratia sp. (in: enterobacteria)]|uniref:hypothetical protein n=1 Tax=Serratia sp. (in: enterobacteria) TaxID=616 RepID=UPI003988C5E1
MDIRTCKTRFLDSLSLSDIQRRAVGLAIDCLIENESKKDDVPLVITSYDDTCRQNVLKALQEFCAAMYPHLNSFFIPRILLIAGHTSEEACVNLIKELRCNSTMLYWADSPSWFSSLPEGLFHVVSIDHGEVFRGLNKQQQRPEIVRREYTNDSLLPELFVNVAHTGLDETTDINVAENKFYDECNSGLIRPIPAPTGARYDEEITISSPDWQKLACVAIRRYQSREFHDGMSWNTSNEGWSSVIAYPFLEEFLTLDGSGFRECLVGLVTMNTSEVEKPYLSTVWIHPFYRRQGYLKRLWPALKEKYGSFEVEAPNSNMQAFLKSVKFADM